MKTALLVALLCTAAFPAATPPPKFEEIAKRAEAARNGNRVPEAIGLYREALRLNENWKEGWWYLGTLLYDIDQYADARDALRHVIALQTDSAPAWALLGLCEFETRQYDLSLAHLHRAQSLGLGGAADIDQPVRFHEAMLLTRSGEFEKALAAYAWFAAKGVDNPSIIEGVGLAALRKPLLPAEDPPQDRELVLAAGRAAYESLARRPKTAQQAFQDLLTRFSDKPNVHYLYGTWLLTSDPDEAVNQFKAELEVSPGSVPSMINLAMEYLRRGDVAPGIPYARKAVEDEPNSFASHYALGRLLVESGDLKGGIEQLETATKLEPNSAQNHIALATAYSKAGRPEDAKREREQFMKLRKELDAASKP